MTVGTFHRFSGVNDFNTLTIAGSGPINLFWSDPLGASGNDYDIFRLNTAGTAVAASATNIQDGNDDPYEQMSNSTASPRIVIVRKTGAVGRFLHLNTNRGQLSVATAGQTHGHAATTNAFTFAVAATPAALAYPNAHSTANVVETFSSDGYRRVIYGSNGAPFTPGNVTSTGGLLLGKPDFTAADGVFVSGAGDFPGQFFGTSASAPAAAAIMALIKSANPAFNQTQLKSALLANVIDIEGPGFDRDSGAGIVMANAPQPGCTFTSPTVLTAGAAGAAGGISVTASGGTCVWQVFSNVPWATATKDIGVGNGAYFLNILANYGPARSGTLTIPSGPTVTVNQAASAAATTSFNNSTVLPLADPPSSSPRDGGVEPGRGWTDAADQERHRVDVRYAHVGRRSDHQRDWPGRHDGPVDW